MTKPPKPREFVVGIDLGTTNSCVAILDGHDPIVIPNRGGYRTTPSMVAITETGKRIVGHIAKRQAITNAEHTVYAAKRLIGRKWSSPQVRHAIESSSYLIAEGPHNDVRIQLRGKQCSVPEISAMVLQEMKVIAEDYLGESVTKAVITVPAYFNDNQRQATKDAGEIAGLEVIRIINEPTAAALSYGYGKRIDKTVAVYDFGGGTFDVSILEIAENGVFRVLATAGDTFLGGEDIDARIIDRLVADFRAQHGVDLRTDRMALQRLKDAAEKAKCELSTLRSTEINLPFILSMGQGEALHLKQVIERHTLEELASDLIERTLDICADALRDSKLTAPDVDELLLVRGMTRMPKIQEAVGRFFGREPGKGVHPDEVVALGAAIQAAALTAGTQDDIVLLDVTPHALGIMTVGNVFEELIPANTTVPTQRAQIFTTSRDNQTAVKILVSQGGGSDSTGKPAYDLLGEFLLTGLRRAGKGTVEIEVTFNIDADGIVSVRAKDLETGLEQSLQITAQSNLSRDEIEAMAQGAADDLLVRREDDDFESAKQEAEGLLNEIRELMPHVEKVVSGSDFGKDALRKARDVLSRAESALQQRDSAVLRGQLDGLARTLRMFKGVVTRA